MAGEDAAEVLAEVIDSYLKMLPNSCKRSVQPLLKGIPALYQAAHTLKPTSATLGAITLSRSADLK